MPGKVNRWFRAVCQVVAQVVGNDAAVASLCAGNSSSTHAAVIASNLLESIRGAEPSILADKAFRIAG